MNVFCGNEEENCLLESDSPFENKVLKMEEIPFEESENFITKEEVEEEEEEEEEEEAEEEVDEEGEEEEILPNDSTMDYEINSESEEIKDMEIMNMSSIRQTDFDEKCFLNDNGLNNAQTESVFNLNLDQKEKVRVEPCGIPISNFQSQSAFHITKDGKMTLFGKQTQAINLMQNGSAILFLSNGTDLSKNYFKINQNGILVKELTTLPIAASLDK